MKSTMLLLLLLSPLSAWALSWGELEAEIDSVESGNPGDVAIIQRMSDVVSAVAAYNRALREAGADELLFCPASGSSIELDRIVSLVRAQARLDQAGPEIGVETLLLRALAREFPC